MRIQLNHVYCDDAIDFMRSLDSQSVSAVITDLPYGTTACKWDEIIPFEPMWAEVRRILKPRGVFVTTASQPFTSKLVMSNAEMFHEEIVWDKVAVTGYLDANRKHMKRHETVLVFCDKTPTYNPQFGVGKPYKVKSRKSNFSGYGHAENMGSVSDGKRYPTSIVRYSAANPKLKPKHPTQKPIELYEYLIRTYTQESDLVCDPCCGSGTTCVAARNLKRNFVACDTTPAYVEIANNRLAEPYNPMLWS